MNKKSQENLDSAELLINAGRYTSSIHCSYYAVFQYAKYILNVCEYKPIPYDKQSLDHSQIISNLESRIEVISGDKTRSASIRSSIHCLKSDRKKADYKVRALKNLLADNYRTCVLHK
ncbi:MAG: HEPN domain-containing protein, partial [Paludibacteraceae bacterium]|nr:HEPN domain-containing protein [Paludibacteraceae bacterium]